MCQIPLIIRKKKTLFIIYNGLLILSVDRIYSIDALSIALLKEFSQFGLPNKRVTIFIFSQNVRIYCGYFVKEGLSLNIKICTIEKEMYRCFNTTTTATHWIY